MIAALTCLLVALVPGGGGERHAGIDVRVVPDVVVWLVQDPEPIAEEVACSAEFVGPAVAFANEKCPCQRALVGATLQLAWSCWLPYQEPWGDEADCVTVSIVNSALRDGICSSGEVQVNPWLECCASLTGTFDFNDCCTNPPCNSGVGQGGVPHPVFCCEGNLLSIPHDPDCAGVGGAPTGQGAPGMHAFSLMVLATCTKTDLEHVIDVPVACAGAAWHEYTNGLATIRVTMKCKCPL